MLKKAESLELDPVVFSTMQNVYIYYDEPILYSFWNDKKELYVCNLIKESVSYQSWLYVRVTVDDLFNFEDGKISLLECINRSKYKDCYVCDENVDGSNKYYKVDKSFLSSKELPSADYYIK